jgi:hypothetical protein
MTVNTGSMRLMSWVSDVLRRKGYHKPQSIPLYQYQVTASDYNHLKQLLRQHGKPDNLKRNKPWCAAFCLFCAEWYRREFESGWTWDGIWYSLGFQLNQADLQHVIPSGLEGYWDRPIRYYESERRNFLGTLFSEGGLPFKVLIRPDSRFQALLSSIIKNYDRVEIFGENKQGLVVKLIQKFHLPQVFLEEVSVELISNMAELLVSLVKSYDLADKDDPVAELDSVNPNWRRDFPIPLDEHTGSELLNGLLKSASVEHRRRVRSDGSWYCEHVWNSANPDKLKVELKFPKELHFPILNTPDTCRFEIFLFEGGRQLAKVGVGYGEVNEHTLKMNVRTPSVSCYRYDPTAELSLVLFSGGVSCGRIPIEKSQVGIGEVPVGFHESSSEYRVCGQSSFRTKQEEVLLLLPSKSLTELSEGVTEGQELLGCSSVSVRGSVVVKGSDGEIYVIKTGVESSSSQYSLHGRYLDWPCRPYQTFLGFPKITSKAGVEGVLDEYTYLSGQPIKSISYRECLGENYLSIRNSQGQTLQRQKIGVLPEDFKIDLVNGHNPNEGKVVFRTSRRCSYEVKDKNIVVNENKADDFVELQLSVDGAPPPTFKVEIVAYFLSGPIEVVLPFPSSGVLAYDKDKKPLARNLAVSELIGSRVYLFAPQGQSINYALELRLARSGQYIRYEWNYCVTDKPVEIALYNLTEHIVNLLSVQDGLDQTVEVRITGARREEVYRIRRHSTVLDFDRFTNRLSVSSLTPLGNRTPKLMAILLAEPDRHPRMIPSRMTQFQETFEYDIPGFMNKNGPWLIVPSEESDLTFRPKYIRGQVPDVNLEGEIKTLQKAVLAFTPETGYKSFEHVFNLMANDPAHSGWQFLMSLYDQYSYLPLATFEVWRALVKYPSTLAMALFKFEMKPGLLMKLESELPVFFEFMSLSCLYRANLKLREHIVAHGIAEGVASTLGEKLIAKLSAVYSVYGEDLQAYILNGPETIKLLPVSVMDRIVSDWYQSLIRAENKDRWPDFGGVALKSWYNRNDTPVSIDSEMNYRSAVVYLPVFAAAVAAGKAQLSDVFADRPEAVFFLRQIRDFDQGWFQSVYRYCLLKYTSG